MLVLGANVINFVLQFKFIGITHSFITEAYLLFLFPNIYVYFLGKNLDTEHSAG